MSPQEIDELLDLLSTMAMYNDKGYQWCNHNERQVDEMRQRYRASLDQWVASVGTEKIPHDVLVHLRSAAVLEESNGDIRDLIRGLLAK
jgi:hypothetical protein